MYEITFSTSQTACRGKQDDYATATKTQNIMLAVLSTD